MRWRLLHDGPADGARQMAVDEALFRSLFGSAPLATVRLYRFRRPTLSIGYGQRVEDVCRPDACLRLGVDWVRRPTGGRALLHQHELTYAVTAPTRNVFARLSVQETYQVVSAALARALERLGVPLDPTLSPDARHRLPREAARRLPCLASPERHELTSGGRKIVASAQRRRREGFLQHGSILRRVDGALWEQIRPDDDDHPLAAVGLEDVLAHPPTEEELRSALASAFQELFGEPPCGRDLDDGERAEADRLEGKYR